MRLAETLQTQPSHPIWPSPFAVGVRQKAANNRPELGPFLAFLAVVFAAMVLAVWRLEIATNYSRSSPVAHKDGNVWSYALGSSKEFCMWTIMSAQILATASSSTVPGVLAFISDAYRPYLKRP